MTVKELLKEYGYEDVIVFENYDYDSAFIGVTHDNRAVYSYDKMVEYLQNKGMTEFEAIEWIDYNTIRALSYYGGNTPVIVYELKREYEDDSKNNT